MGDKPDTNQPANADETGRYLIFFHPGTLADTAKIANKVAGITMFNNNNDAEIATASNQWQGLDTIVIPSIGVAISSAAPDQIERLRASDSKAIRYVRKELIFKIADSLPGDISISPEYLRGYRDGVNGVIAGLMNGRIADGDAEIMDANSFRDNMDFTWGLQAIGLNQSRLTGKNIRLAVLDTGIDFDHPDFKTRQIQSQSFIAGTPTAKDDNGHGTHCLGTVSGPGKPSEGPRYGVAPDAELFVGKVMKADGKGNEGDILHGIGWAIQNKCRIISLSVGKEVARGDAPIEQYEQIGQVALDNNCLIVAAAGNNSNRPGQVSPVTIPANSSTVMAVGAIDRRLNMFNRSNGGINRNGGGVDLVGPGVDILSSKPLPFRYGTDTGTSMSTPHVAGAAALLMESNANASAERIWTRLTQTAKRLNLSSTDVGSGLVQVVA